MINLLITSRILSIYKDFLLFLLFSDYFSILIKIFLKCFDKNIVAIVTKVSTIFPISTNKYIDTYLYEYFDILMYTWDPLLVGQGGIAL